MSRMKNWGKHTHVGEVINFIETLPCDQTFIRTYLPIVQREYSSDIYFLSVIMRTQGKRPHELFEALFSLTLQLDKDFEVLVVCHNADDSALVSVQDILRNESLSSLTIRMIQVDGGSRATPLNHGFAHARGEYIACLDDDDTVSDNWVSSFHKAAKARPGTMLHTQIIVQEWDRDENGAFPCGDENHIYCKPYNEIIQLAYNSCPLHSIAFPGYIFRQCGIIFNEELTTVEDWDMLIRVQGLTGVTEIPHPTGLYKFWKNRDNSYSSHSQEEWAKNHKLVKDNIANSLYILSRGGVSSAIELVERKNELEGYTSILHGNISNLEKQVVSGQSKISNLETCIRIQRSIIKIFFYPTYYFTYLKYAGYKFLSKITSGKTRKRFFTKKEEWKQRRNFLRHM